MIDGYAIALFIHLLGVVTLFGAFVVVQRAGDRLRKAETVPQAQTWVELIQSTLSMVIAGGVMLFVTGVFMVAVRWQDGANPWATPAMMALLTIAVSMTLVHRRHFARIRRLAASAPDGPSAQELGQVIASPGPWAVVSAMNGLAIGCVWLMAAKPDWVGSAVSLVIIGLAGGVIGLLVARRQASSLLRNSVQPDQSQLRAA